MNKCKDCQHDYDETCPMNGRQGSHKYCFVQKHVSEIEFCRRWCGELTPEQEGMLECVIKKGTFLGVGRAVGRMVFMPLARLGNTVNVIDNCGYYQLASTEGRKAFDAQ